MPDARYQRILLKLSGESLAGKARFGIDSERLEAVASEIGEVASLGVRIGIVVGGGNLFRGLEASRAGVERSTADTIGMLATVMNALSLQDVLENRGVVTRVLTAIKMDQVAEPFIRRRAVRHLEKGRVVIFAAGTGNPYFTTDTCAALRASELSADIILKATKVDGVYDSDPATHPGATRFAHLTYREVRARELKVMDATAITMAQEHATPILVFNFKTPGNFQLAVNGEEVGTLISEEP